MSGAAQQAAVQADLPDLLERVAELVDIPSVSRNEAAIADHVEAALSRHERPRGAPSSATTSSPVRTSGCPQRLILAGHLDTVPAERQREGRRR